MTAPGPDRTFLIVASTDLDRAQIMMTRIREQMEKLSDLKAYGCFEVSAVALPSPGPAAGDSLQQQVEEVAGIVAQTTRAMLHGTSDGQDRNN
jgi:hypothetical protein